MVATRTGLTGREINCGYLGASQLPCVVQSGIANLVILRVGTGVVELLTANRQVMRRLVFKAVLADELFPT